MTICDSDNKTDKTDGRKTRRGIRGNYVRNPVDGADLFQRYAMLLMAIMEHLDIPEYRFPRSNHVYEDDDMFSPIASGSHRHDGMVIAPCSESTVAKIANGIADTLITRAASVCIKEGRRLVLLVRETPKSAIMLENELKLARLGVVIMDANPGFYPRPTSVEEVVVIVVGRCLDQLGVDAGIYGRWGSD